MSRAVRSVDRYGSSAPSFALQSFTRASTPAMSAWRAASLVGANCRL